MSETLSATCHCGAVHITLPAEAAGVWPAIAATVKRCTATSTPFWQAPARR